ncbi:HNH endonuclease [Streptomyces sp. 900116325]
MAQRICDTPDCGKPHRARGLCSAHWKRRYAPTRTYAPVPCCVCGEPALKTSGRERIVCSLACRWFVQNERQSSDVWFIECAWCDALFTSRAPGVRWCWDSCKAIDIRTVWPSCRVRYTTCSQCDRLFVTPYTVSTCSPACAVAKLKDDKREAKHKRRARQRDAYVANVSRRAIYERDRWMCHLCGKKINRDAEVPDPLAPTLDHVIPLAAGGTHEPANVRAAHYRCNSIKGDGYIQAGEQLMLIG